MYKENEIEDIFDEKVNEQTYENIIKCLKVLKKGKDSFFNCIKNNRYLIKLSLNYLLKNYYFYLIQKTNNKINITLPDNEDSEILKEEIYNFLNFYKSNCKPNNEYTKDFSEIFFSLCQYNEFIDKLKKNININICSIEASSLNYSDFMNSTFSYFESILSKDLLIILLYYIYILMEKEKPNEQNPNKNKNKEKSINEVIKYYYNIIEDEFLIIIKEYSQIFINEKIEQKYEKYISIFSNLKSYSFESNFKIDFKLIKKSDYIYLLLVLIYIYQKYPSYKPWLLYYAYQKYFKKDSKQFFISFINCIKDKQNESNIPIHLFLEKIGNNESLKKYITKNLINLKYSKNSLFYEFIDQKIEKALQKNNIEKIAYIIFYYTSDKNNDIYKRIIDKLNDNFKISFYNFVEYDSEIYNRQNMIKTIKILENLSKNTINASQNFEEIKGGKKEKKIKIEDKKNEKLSLKEFKISFKNKKKTSVEKSKKKSQKNKFLYKSNSSIELRLKSIKKEFKRKIELLSKKNKYYNVINKIRNLYIFFRILKKQNKKLINIIDGNYIFLRETIDILLNYIIYTSFAAYNSKYIKKIKNKRQTESLNKQIYEFFRELFLNKKNNEILAKYFENPIIIGKKEFRLRILNIVKYLIPTNKLSSRNKNWTIF